MKAPTMPHFMCVSGCAGCRPSRCNLRCSRQHILDVDVDDRQQLVLTVESDQWSTAARVGSRGRPVVESDTARRALLRPGDAGALAGADLALSRVGLSGRHLQ